jgi:3-deoxy-D-manno-octulosonate 8-phosphate phosphatase KdsC-like HAD superfamily phosphatase
MMARSIAHFLLPLLFASVAAAQETTQAPAQSPPPDPPRATDAPPAAIADAPRGLLAVAEMEAARSARALRDSIRARLRNFAQAQDTAADRGKGLLDSVVTLGPDAVPLLFEVLRDVDRGALDASFAVAAARALCGIYDRTKNKEILAALEKSVLDSGPAVRHGALEGMAQLDDPHVVDIAVPLLASNDPTLVARAVRVLGRQQASAEAVGAQLRPLLQQQGAPLAEVVAALDSLTDLAALDSVHGMVAKADDPALLLACVRYLSRHGTRASVAPLGKLLLRAEGPLSEVLLKQGVDAVQVIGLRHSDAQAGAIDLLLEAWRKLRSSKIEVSNYARWQLGPFKNEEALKSLEDEVEEAIANNKKMRSSNLGRYIELAKDRLRFEAWGKAVSALDKASDEDTRKNRIDEIKELRAVALYGQGKPTGAEALFHEMAIERRLALLQEYPILQKMAREPRFKDLFPQGR